MFDLIIVGGGPAGVSAGVYAARKQLNTLLITSDWGGQSIVSTEIQNWIGTAKIAGSQLALDLKNHLLAYADPFVSTETSSMVTNITKTEAGTFIVTTSQNNTHETKSVLIASGSGRRHLSAPRADEFEHKGLTYCASCDGPMFAGQDVAVIGGGNAAFETAAQLLAYAKSVTLFNRGNDFKADPVTVKIVLANEKMTAVRNSEITGILGDKFVSGLTYTENGEAKELAVTGIFVEIGMIPNTDFAKDAVELDEYNRIKIDPWTQKTSTPGIWAAGDCTNIKYHQNNISAGDAVRALEDIYVTLKTK